MRLYAKPIKNFANINQFDYTTEWHIRKDEQNTLYFQLIDLDQNGLRYLPSNSPYSVQVTFPALSSPFTKSASPVNVLDNSLWSVSLSATEVPHSGNVQFTLTESGVIRRFSLIDGLIVEHIDDGGC